MGRERNATFYWPFPFKRKGRTLTTFQWPQRFGVLGQWQPESHRGQNGELIVYHNHSASCHAHCSGRVQMQSMTPIYCHIRNKGAIISNIHIPLYFLQISEFLGIGFWPTSCSLMDNITPVDCNHSVTLPSKLPSQTLLRGNDMLLRKLVYIQNTSTEVISALLLLIILKDTHIKNL